MASAAEWAVSIAKPFPSAEMYVRIEDGKAVLYAVCKLENGRGKIVGSRTVPTLPGGDNQCV
jgi:hypothetical protein